MAHGYSGSWLWLLQAMAGRPHKRHSICRPQNPTLGNPLLRYGHFKFSNMAAGRHLGFDATGKSAKDPLTPKTLPRTKHGVNWTTGCRDMNI